MTRSVLATAPAYLLVAGCALLPARAESVDPPTRLDVSSEVRFQRALNALEVGLYRVAFADLVHLYMADPGGADGQRAVLVLTATELDPRNPVRRPAEGARIAGEALRQAEASHWTNPVLTSFYLLALEHGAPAPDDASAVMAAAPQLRGLPSLPTTPWPERLSQLVTREAELAERVTELEEERDALRRELAEKTRELERIRRTLRP